MAIDTRAPIAVEYPTLAGIVPPTPAVPGGNTASGGTPAIKRVVPWHEVGSDIEVRGALKVNPAIAGHFVALRWTPEWPVPGNNEPNEVKSKTISQALATLWSFPWKSRPANPESDAIRFGNNKPQTPAKHPWNKRFIPPLALFNDAAQWVNLMYFNAPNVRTGFNSSIFPLKAQYFTPPPLNSANLAGGTLNLQAQLGNISIQGMQLTTVASNAFGG